VYITPDFLCDSAGSVRCRGTGGIEEEERMAGSGESSVGEADLAPDPEVAYWLEMSEARAMADVYRAAADTSDNPVGCQVAEIGGGVAFALTSIDVGFFNRTIGLGIERAATEADVDAVVAFYEGLDRSVAVAQVAPHAAPPDLIGWLEARGFARSARWAKVWRTLDDLPQATTSLRIERIDRSQTDAFGSIGVEAFGCRGGCDRRGAGTSSRHAPSPTCWNSPSAATRTGRSRPRRSSRS